MPQFTRRFHVFLKVFHFNMTRKVKPKKLSSAQLWNLKKCAVNTIGASCRKLAQKFNVSKSYASKNLAEMNVYYWKRSNALFITEGQTKIIPARCRKLRREIFKSDREIIVDDEKYFTLSNGFLTINKGFINLQMCLCLLMWIISNYKNLNPKF